MPLFVTNMEVMDEHGIVIAKLKGKPIEEAITLLIGCQEKKGGTGMKAFFNKLDKDLKRVWRID